MSSWSDNTLETIRAAYDDARRAAYADARRDQPAEQPPLPEWLDLPIELRVAMIHVFSAGRRHVLAEQHAKRREGKP
jgi:hypothetical protein